MHILVIYNPVCGDGTASEFFKESVLPRLQEQIKLPIKIAATEREHHAGDLVNEFIASNPGDVTVIVGSGDGTVHEIVNAASRVHFKEGDNSSSNRTINLVLVPCGTANALYSSLFPPAGQGEDPVDYKLRSLKSFMEGSKPKQLILTKTSLPTSSASPSEELTTIFSIVVTSTALHASILHDSESLRREMPGIERFKVAARNNITRWYKGSATLQPAPSVGEVQIYDPGLGLFLAQESADNSLTLHGPFAYFLSTVNVDRLEPAFRIAPLGIENDASRPCLDLVIVRPSRDPSIIDDTDETRAAFAEKLGRVLGEAYNDGSHIKLRYGSDGQAVTDGDGKTIVEYYRCGGFEWAPDEADDRAHLLCADGAIFHIPSGGKAACTATSSTDNGVYFKTYT